MLARIRPTQRTLLSPVALEHRGIQIQTISRRTSRKPFQLPTPQAGEKTLALSLSKRLNRLRMVSSTGKREIPSTACKAASARSKLVCAKRRARATTESEKAVKVSAGSIALGEVRRNGRCLLTASR